METEQVQLGLGLQLLLVLLPVLNGS